ncbi:MAG: DUF2213 domain-containing protein [Planctomycetaceae bacterium]|nr:DUF2213 domain-containing protein [Planctomycetaceae bacterium]
MVVNALYRFQDPSEWINAPVRMMRSGVFSNDWGDWTGPTLFELDALRRSLPYWDRLSVTIEHPAEFVTNSYAPEIVGAVEDVQIYNEFLVGRVWLHRESIGLDLLHRIENRSPIEVSAAYWVNPRHEAGSYRGEQFNFKVQNLLPNHLAILPSTQGAFGLRHGCGIFPPAAVSSGIVTNVAGSTRRGKAQPNPLRAARNRPKVKASPVPPPTRTSQL